MRVLVTGGAGFIGSHLSDRLLAEGHQVTVLDDLSNGRLANLDGAVTSDRFRFVELDVTGPELAAAVAEAQPEVIFHLAAQVDVRASVADPLHDAKVNVLGTIAVLEAARAAGTRKVLFASSVAIYGPTTDLPVAETAPANPLSPYASSKLTGETYLRQYRQLHGVDFTALAFGNVYGPRQDPHGEAGVVAIFAGALTSGGPTKVFGEGGNTRDYIYVGDIVDALVKASAKAGGGQRFNLGTGVETSDLELHRIVAKAAGVDQEPELAPARPGDLAAMVLDSSAAHTELGWRPATDLAEGVANVVAWARQRASVS
ncbi:MULTISPECIES: NAD-dependent epimerase/dehydratase family protein [unclassified Crossiella]|uniref:NAD-dependent epimerase/dehydratase family protein n=1 Tax=unclassified Crossiella TaxID=2620835 RepID=UPI001FFEDF70|nr:MULTISPECIES: NAD-dependent epimerase/dehydratase family protein [unclassified Crossiella]MCK2237520.1 GDP-mannose 4,6-dehydratase [Crossiella sp. S99.2]MCK2254806.1 GDP-mannose 4,6-dehydratase [Crossiella sp. S99.1]